MILEIAANSTASARNAQEGGADRLELCTELGVGGLTPSHGLITVVREQVDIPIYVLVRPRSGDFRYTEDELELMERDIRFCVSAGCEGIVSGVLTSDFRIDKAGTSRLMAATGEAAFTFHRAFDWTSDPMQALGDLLDLGVTTLLTSGQEAKAEAGLPLLSALQEKAGDRCTIMPGGGVSPDNAGMFRKAGFRAVHASATIPLERLPKAPPISMTSPQMLNERVVFETNAERVRGIRRALSTP